MGTTYYTLFDITKNGTIKWKIKTGYYIVSAPAFDDNGIVYIGTWDGKLYAINPDGKIIWEFETESSISCNPVIDENGVIYFVDENKVYAVNADGTKKWDCMLNDIGMIFHVSPVVGNNSMIYVLTYGGLYALNQEGTIVWDFKVDNASTYASSPILDNDGSLYFGLSNQLLYSIKTDCSGPASSMWPMYGCNAQHTFNVFDQILKQKLAYASRQIDNSHFTNDTIKK